MSFDVSDIVKIEYKFSGSRLNYSLIDFNKVRKISLDSIENKTKFGIIYNKSFMTIGLKKYNVYYVLCERSTYILTEHFLSNVSSSDACKNNLKKFLNSKNQIS